MFCLDVLRRHERLVNFLIILTVVLILSAGMLTISLEMDRLAEEETSYSDDDNDQNTETTRAHTVEKISKISRGREENSAATTHHETTIITKKNETKSSGHMLPQTSQLCKKNDLSEAMKKGATGCERLENNRTLLMNAIKYCSEPKTYKIVEGLLMSTKEKCRNEFDAADNFGRTALLEAVTEQQLKTVKFLLNANVSVEVMDAAGRTPLTTALANGTLPSITKLLIRFNADPNLREGNEAGPTPLIICAIRADCSVSIFDLLVEKGANLNDRDLSAGRTALMHAASEGRLAIVQRLLESGADKTAKDTYDMTAIDLAQRSSSSDKSKIIQLLNLAG